MRYREWLINKRDNDRVLRVCSEVFEPEPTWDAASTTTLIWGAVLALIVLGTLWVFITAAIG